MRVLPRSLRSVSESSQALAARARVAATVALAVTLFVLGASAQQISPTLREKRLDSRSPEPSVNALPMPRSIALVENAGQWPPHVRFASIGAGLRACATSDGIGLEVIDGGGAEPRLVALRLSVVSPSAAAVIEPLGARTEHYNFLLGNDPDGWRTDVRCYDAVRWHGLRQGVDMELRASGSTLSYVLFFARTGDLAALELRVEGADALEIEPSGVLNAITSVGELHQSAPIAWYEHGDGTREPVDCRFRLRDQGRFAFELGAERKPFPLVIDPGLTWSTLLGSTGEDQPTDVAFDSAGRVTVAGYTWSSTFPSTSGVLPYTANSDGFVSRFEPSSSTLLFTSFVGGHGNDEIHDMVLEPSGRVYVAGRTTATDFPVTAGAYDPTYNGMWDGFAARLRADGSALLYSTYIGGSKSDSFYALGLDSLGQPTLAGESESTNYPTTPGAYDTTTDGFGDAVVTRLNAAGTGLVFSTFIGGSIYDIPRSLDIDSIGNTYVTGLAGSGDFPTTPGAFQESPWSPGFVIKFSPSGALLASTFLGGSGGADLHAVRVGPGQRVYVSGWTQSTDFPVTPGAYDTTFSGGFGDTIVSCFDADLSVLKYSTFFGGTGNDIERAYDIALGASGDVTIVGFTTSQVFPTTAGCSQPAKQIPAYFAGFVARMNPDLSKLLYSTYLNGYGSLGGGLSINTSVVAVAIQPNGEAVVTGNTAASNFPTTPGAFQATPGGHIDGFVTQLDLMPTGVQKYGSSTSSCSGPISIGVTKMPVQGEAGFALTSSGSPPGAAGLLAICGGSVPAGFPLLGLQAFLDPATPLFVFSAAADEVGWSERGVLLPSGSQGVTVYSQFVWLNTASCGGAGTLSASDALALTIQP